MRERETAVAYFTTQRPDDLHVSPHVYYLLGPLCFMRYKQCMNKCDFKRCEFTKECFFEKSIKFNV